MKKSIIISLFLLISGLGFSQTHYTVSGKIIDKNSKAALQGASVFAQNTTFGVATDAEGQFTLRLPAGGYDLVVTYTGYETESVRINNATAEDKNFSIELKPRERSLEEVSVVVSTEVKDGWVKYGGFFFENFIGKSEFSQQCQIRNPEVLKFYFSKKRNRLRVLANEPLVVANNALGYNIKYAIDSFTYDYNTSIAFFAGYPLFEEMEGDDVKKTLWKENREVAYAGSMLHFMRSLYNKTVEHEGFEVQFLVKNDDKETALQLKDIYPAINYLKDDSAKTVEFRPNQPDIAVIYKYEKPEQVYLDLFDTNGSKELQVSLLNILPNESIVIEANGYYYEQADLTFNGYWGFEKVGDMVPYDFVVGK
ncbi:MAG: carboxypeptidase-like regulatory domain-containing protein [Chitinophagaceae bacterium]